MATVELKNVNKIYEGSVHAVKDANITIQDREFVVLVGPSGCGKTTTLRMVAGLEEISSGELFIDDKMVNDVPPKDRDIAMVFQNYALYPHMTVFDNMAFGLKIRKYEKQEIQKRVDDAAEILEIKELLARRPKQLSGGQRQRVAVGRAIVRHPKVFLFDEPLSNLDAKLRVQMRAEISSLHTRLQATMIYVTHDQVEAMTMGDKIVVMRDGLIQQIGDPLTLYNKPVNRFVAGFMGSPPMNFMTLDVKKDGSKISLDEGEFSFNVTGKNTGILEPYAGKSIIFGFRAEDLSHSAKESPGKSIPVAISVIEPLGAETHVYGATTKHQLIARIEPNIMLNVGDTTYFSPDMDKVIFFDPETDEAINIS